MDSPEHAATIRIDGRAARDVACPLCAGRETRTLFARHGFRWEKCSGCGLVRVSPQLLPDAIADIYREGYRDKSARTARVETPLSAAENRILDTLARYAGAPGSLLDVGCFEGRFIRAATAAGWNPVGTEISREAAAYAQDHAGLDVRLGTLEDIAFADDTFDAVVLLDVIEHVPDPRSTMDEVHRVLRPGGVVYLWTPNFDCITRRFARGHWGAVVFPWHLHYFGPATLRRLAAETGFAPLHIGSRNWLLDFRDRYAALKAGRALPRQNRVIRRARRALDAWSQPFFAGADRRGRHWGAQIELYARKVTP